MKDNQINRNTCGCCEGVEVLTPAVTANRPGLSALAYRIGTHATFIETMKARLSSHFLDAAEEQNSDGKGIVRPLKLLRTRDASDPAIALLDAWATVADVLTFYQERIANEGFLRTATERRSVLELARLIGYKLRPGVASSVYLAYTLEEDRSVTPPKPTAVTIPAGSRAQSVPGPGELPQSFETEEPLNARSEWNTLQLRMTQPQTQLSIMKRGLYLKGLVTRLQPDDALLIDFDGSVIPVRVVAVEPDAAADRTHVSLRLWRTVKQTVAGTRAAALIMRTSEFPTKKETAAAKKLADDIESMLGDLENAKAGKQLDAMKKMLEIMAGQLEDNEQKGFEELNKQLKSVIADLELTSESLMFSAGQPFDQVAPATPAPATLDSLLPALIKEPLRHPGNALELSRTVATTYSAGADVVPRLLTTLQPVLESGLYPALENALTSKPAEIHAYAFRVTASLFGHNASRQPLKFNRETGEITDSRDWLIIEEDANRRRRVHESEGIVNLDASYDKILPGSWVMVETPETKLTKAGLFVTQPQSVKAGVGRAEYGMNGKTTRIALGTPIGPAPAHTWIQLAAKHESDSDFDAIRLTVVYAQSEELDLAEAPIETPIGKCDPNDPSAAAPLELDGLYDGLDAGRWLIVSGERVIEGTSGVKGSELVMLGGVEHRALELPGEKTHTFLQLALDGLAYCYRRDTVRIYGNVVAATNGETRNEVLGGGDGSKALQTFALKQPPLTYVSASTPSGVESTLKVRVNDVLWHEADSLADLKPGDRRFITKTDDDANTSVIFGNGERGARLPTGVENIKAVYRNGIGKPGNVKAEQISLLTSRPLGVKEVINPVRASGGADSDSRDAARRNAPLTVTALDRLVSVQDYEDFAHTFAGIGKANATRLSNGREQLVFLTIAGADDIPIDEGSDLYKNLFRALHQFGDPNQPIQIKIRTLMLLVISAGVRLDPDYLWESVEPKIRAALLDTFSFERRELGQDVFLSEVIATIQKIEGVTYVDVDLLDGIPESLAGDPQKLDVKLQSLATTGFPQQPQARILVDMPAPGNPQPAQLAYLTPNIPDTLILKELPS